ncbi:MAG: ParB/RepB/Spo0J family partition protein [Deltaproteobacteria bacterium]|nr:ParB/RepB/Spo0J family partition protein [Candidatus Tharpella aukensis]
MDIPAKKGALLKHGLGRGLGALLPDAVSPEKGPLRQCRISLIEPDAKQPRRRFVDENLEELAQSIKEHGVIQPLLVRAAEKAGHYTLIAGERRLRAAGKAGLAEVPVIVMALDEVQGLQVSLIENLQREDLNPLEEAQGYYRLAHEFSLTHTEIAKFLSKSRTTISNMLRLLNLPEKAQLCLAEEQLTMGHGRALLALPEGELQDRALSETLEKKLSVRELEKLVRKLKKEEAETAPVEESSELKEKKELQFKEDQSISQRLQKTFTTGIRIRRQSGGRGRIELDFKSSEEFERLLGLLESERA